MDLGFNFTFGLIIFLKVVDRKGCFKVFQKEGLLGQKEVQKLMRNIEDGFLDKNITEVYWVFFIYYILCFDLFFFI